MLRCTMEARNAWVCYAKMHCYSRKFSEFSNNFWNYGVNAVKNVFMYKLLTKYDIFANLELAKLHMLYQHHTKIQSIVKR